jgi:hypothetical protein
MPGAAAIRTQGPDIQAAFAAENAGNYTEAMRVWRKIDAEPEVDVAYPSGKGNVQLGGFTSAGLYADGLAEARYKIAYYYEFGLGLNRNYTEAAAFYQKAVSTTDLNGNRTLFGTWATKRLGFLYAYGLGVPKDRAKARQLWAALPDGVDSGKGYVRLLDNNALPQNIDDPNRFSQEVKDALARLDAEDARKQAVADQKREKEAAAEMAKYYREHPQAAKPSDQGSGSGSSGKKDNCTLGDWMNLFPKGGTLGGLYLANGCPR